MLKVGNFEFKWKSKTLWFNVLALLIIVARVFGFGDFVPDIRLAEYGAIVVTIINLVLRFVTKEPIVALRR